MTPTIELRDVTKDYRTHRALDRVSMTIGDGVTGLLGPNGAGKSTLIKVLLGLVATTSGEGKVLGLDIRSQGRAIRGKVGYMPEDDAYIPGMSGVEMVRFTAALNGLPTVEGLRRAHEILDFCGMGQERYRDVDTYSTGMRQKLKFAQAIVHDPDLLILDEPTSGLDPEERVAMLNRVRSLVRSHGKRAVISTHILPDVRQVCDSVVIIAAGKVTLEASMAEVDRPEEPGLYVRTIGPIDAILERLARAAPAKRIDDRLLFLAGDQDGREGEIWQAAAACGAVVEAIYPRRNSLEAVFMNAVRESHHADS